MPSFYRGAGIGTYWHENDPRNGGFIAQDPNISTDHSRLLEHIARGTVDSPFISLTRSRCVAEDYAITWSRAIPSQQNPAYLYEIVIDDPIPTGLQILDPVKVIGTKLNDPLTINTYQHNGNQDFLLGVIDPTRRVPILNTMCTAFTPSGTPSSPNLSIELEALVRALRDTEILAIGTIPSRCIKPRIPIY